MEINELLKLADEALASDVLTPEIIEAIQRYFDGFESLLPELQQLKASHQDALRQLSAKHDAIINRAIGLRDDTSREIRELKKRGKGIMAYTDVYPKKISITRVKKG